MMRYWILALLVAGMVVIAGYALVQPLQMPQQVMTTSTANNANIVGSLDSEDLIVEFYSVFSLQDSA